MKKWKIGIREAIELCIENGVDEASAQLESYDKAKPNRLKTNQVVALQGNLECFYSEVIISGSGKRGSVTLSGAKEKPTERITGNSTNGKKATEEDEIIKEYFFNQLVNRVAPREEGWAETVNLWGRDWVNKLEVSDYQWERFAKELTETFSVHEVISDERIKEILFNIKDNLRKNYRSLAIKSIEKLEKERRIETELEFYQVLAKGSYIVSLMQPLLEAEGETLDLHNPLDEDRHSEIIEGLNELLKPLGMDYSRYKIVSAFPKFAVKEEREVIKLANKWLFEQHSIDYMYSRTRIYVIDTAKKKEISKAEAEEAYINRIIKYTNARMNRKDYKNTHKFQASFYRLSMFILLDMKSVKELKNAIANEKLMIKEKIESCLYEYAIKYGDSLEAQQREKITYGFGEEALTKTRPAIEMPFDVSEMFNFEPVEVAEEKEVVNMKKPENNANLIDISLIGLEDDEPIKKHKKSIPVFGAYVNGFIVPNRETYVSDYEKARMEDADFEEWHEEDEVFENNISSLSL